MNRLILILLLLTFWMELKLFAQLEKEPPSIIEALSMMDKLIVGLNYSNLSGKDAISTKYSQRFFCGLSSSVFLSRNFETMLEVAYSGKGAKQNFQNQINEFRLHTFQSGILFKYNFIPKQSHFMPSIISGILLSGNLSTDGILMIKRHTEQGGEVFIPYEYAGYSWEAIIGGGIDIVSHKEDKIKRIIGLELRYTLGLETITQKDIKGKIPSNIKNEDIILRNNVLSLNFVLYF